MSSWWQCCPFNRRRVLRQQHRGLTWLPTPRLVLMQFVKEDHLSDNIYIYWCSYRIGMIRLANGWDCHDHVSWSLLRSVQVHANTWHNSSKDLYRFNSVELPPPKYVMVWDDSLIVLENHFISSCVVAAVTHQDSIPDNSPAWTLRSWCSPLTWKWAIPLPEHPWFPLHSLIMPRPARRCSHV